MKDILRDAGIKTKQSATDEEKMRKRLEAAYSEIFNNIETLSKNVSNFQNNILKITGDFDSFGYNEQALNLTKLVTKFKRAVGDQAIPELYTSILQLKKRFLK